MARRADALVEAFPTRKHGLVRERTLLLRKRVAASSLSLATPRALASAATALGRRGLRILVRRGVDERQQENCGGGKERAHRRLGVLKF